MYKNTTISAQQPLTAQQVREDIQFLHLTLQKRHPNLYLYTPQPGIDSVFGAMAALARDNMSETELYNLFSGCSEAIRDGHTLFFPGEQALNRNNNNSRFFPFKLFCAGERMWIELNYSAGEPVEAGAEILQLNGVKSAGILRHLYSKLMHDGDNNTYPTWILNNYFSEYYSYCFGHPDTFTLEIQTPSGLRETKTIAALPKSVIRENRNRKYPGRLTARGLNQQAQNGLLLQLDTTQHVAFLTIRDFDNEVLESVYHQTFKKVIPAYFEQIKKANPDKLIIDLRGNQGGDLENGIVLLSFILNQPYRTVESYAVVKKAGQHRLKKIYRPGLRTYQPRADHFKGAVVILVDGGSFSNSGIVSAAFQRYKRGLLVGEETGGSSQILAGYETSIHLPHSGITVQIPTRQFVLDSSKPFSGHGVMPDYLVQPAITDLIKGKDPVLEKAFSLH